MQRPLIFNLAAILSIAPCLAFTQAPAVVLPAAAQPEAVRPPALLLADTLHPPTVTISWQTRDGKEARFAGVRNYRSQGDKTLIGGNIEAYVALGGTRVDRAQGDPRGASVRCGLYKVDSGKPLFTDISDDAVITITLSGIRMNQPAEPRVRSGLMHLKYMTKDLDACGIDSTGRNLFVTVDPDDPLKPTVTEGSGRFGWLDGGEGHGEARGIVETDGSVTLTFAFPYSILRHTKDPEQRTTPGSFFEPQHFHVEMELLPLGAHPES